MSILVTGGAGFIGSNLLHHLTTEYDEEIICIDKLTYASNLNNIPDSIQFYKTDIVDEYDCESVFKKHNPRVIFHLAAESHVDRSIDNPKKFITSNVYGVFVILESIKEQKDRSKLIHISTDEVYGDIKKKYSSKETDAYNPSSPYSASKAAGDLLIKSYVRTYKIPAIITNCCNNFGPNQYPEKLIPKIIYNILNKKLIPIYGEGKNEREWIYVEDHCNALMKIAEKGIIGENYNIGSGIILNNIQIAEKIISNFEKIIHAKNIKSKIYFVKDRPGHDLRYCLNSSKIKNKLQWKCKSSFDERINETIIWYINKFNNNYFKKKDFKYRIGLNI